jgi:hypothetical protein
MSSRPPYALPAFCGGRPHNGSSPSNTIVRSPSNTIARSCITWVCPSRRDLPLDFEVDFVGFPRCPDDIVNFLRTRMTTELNIYTIYLLVSALKHGADVD